MIENELDISISEHEIVF